MTDRLFIDVRDDIVKSNKLHEEVIDFITPNIDRTLFNEIRNRVDTEDLITEITSEPSIGSPLNTDTLNYEYNVYFYYRETIPALEARDQVDNFPPAHHYQYIPRQGYNIGSYWIYGGNAGGWVATWNGRYVGTLQEDPRPFGYLEGTDGNFYFVGERQGNSDHYSIARLGSRPVITVPGRHARAETVTNHIMSLPYSIEDIRTDIASDSYYRERLSNLFARHPFVTEVSARQRSRTYNGVSRINPYVIVQAGDRREDDEIEATVYFHPGVTVTDLYSINPTRLRDIDLLWVGVYPETNSMKFRYRFKGIVTNFDSFTITFGQAYSATNLNYRIYIVTR